VRIPDEVSKKRREALASLLSETDKAEIGALVDRGARIYAIRRVREMTGMSLIDARLLVESLSQ
jgi:ribosomal protein L7/L12